MTIEEKLQHFYDLSVEEAGSTAEDDLRNHKARLEEMLNQHKQARKQDSEEQLKAETANAKREINKALSAEQLTLKRELNARENELKDQLFVDVKEKLNAFRSTAAYKEYLIRKIRDAVAFAGDDELFVYLSPEDAGLLQELSASVGFPIQLANESFIGGMRAEIPSKNILIDNSFTEALRVRRREFNFDGGAKA